MQIPPKDHKIRLNITLSPKQVEKLKKVAKIENRSQSNVIGFAIEKLEESYK